MTKQDLISTMAANAEITKSQATKALNGLIGAVMDSLRDNERTVLPSIGSLTVTNRPAREGRNPRTGEKLVIAAGKKITFKAAKELKEAV